MNLFSFSRKNYRFENFLIFLTCVLLFILNGSIFLNRNYSELNYFFSSYLNDLMAPLLLFSYSNLFLLLINKKLYSLKYLIIIILLCSFVWEYLVILFKPTSVTDPIDVLFYILGTLIYWAVHKHMIQKRDRK